jgi:hypothetical protein
VGEYQDELREINHKSRIVYNRRGIYPFLDDGICGDMAVRPKEIPGYQIFYLYPKIFDHK